MRPAIAVFGGDGSDPAIRQALSDALDPEVLEPDAVLGQPQISRGGIGRGAEGFAAVIEWIAFALAAGVIGGAAWETTKAGGKRLTTLVRQAFERKPDSIIISRASCSQVEVAPPTQEGPGGESFLGSNQGKEAATVTPAEIIYHRRLHVIERAAKVGPTRACLEAGVSRTSYYRWCERASRYGLSALMPKARRRPHVSTQTPAHEEEIILAEAIARPTLGARRLLEHLEERSVHRSGSGVQKVLRRHHLGTRRERVAALAALTAADTGLVAPRALEPYGFCLWASRPGDLVGLDCFYVGKLKGIGPIWQLTAVDTNSRWAFARLVVGHVSSRVAAMFLHQLAKETWQAGIVLSGVLTDNGPEFIGGDFRAAVRDLELVHHRTPPRSPDHNAVVERFHGTVLQECYRPAFHRRRFDRLADLERVLQDFLGRYNTRRRNHGDYMKGRTPAQMLERLSR